MTVNLVDKGAIELVGICSLEEAELLFQYLLEDRSRTVDWRKCERAHTAVIQLLLASTCPLRGPPAGEFLRNHVEPALMRNRAENPPFLDGVEVRNSKVEPSPESARKRKQHDI